MNGSSDHRGAICLSTGHPRSDLDHVIADRHPGKCSITVLACRARRAFVQDFDFVMRITVTAGFCLAPLLSSFEGPQITVLSPEQKDFSSPGPITREPHTPRACRICSRIEKAASVWRPSQKYLSNSEAIMRASAVLKHPLIIPKRSQGAVNAP